MPRASPPLTIETPAALSASEAEFIVTTIKEFYGANAVIRNFGPDPKRIEIHIEADRGRDMTLYECLGVLLTRIDRDQFSLEITKRGSKIHGNAKIAYRQGVIL